MKEWLADKLDRIARFLGNTFGIKELLGVNGFKIVGWIGLGLIALIIIVILICVCVAKKKKAKKNAESTDNAVTEEKPAEPEVKETVAAESVVVEEPKVEEKPVEEPKAEVKAEEIKAEEPKKEEKKESAKKPVAKSEKPKAEKAEKVEKSATKSTAKPKALGKWMIERKSDDEYISVLFASNGEAMLTSETYVSEDGARKGVATIVKAVENGDFVIYKNKNGNYYFKLKSAANRLLCAGEIYKDKAGCESAVESVKRIAKDSPVIEEVSDGEKYLAYTPVALTDADLKGAAKGKWKIEKNDDGKFFAILYASNGQVMLSTEEVASKPTALAGIENVKKNALAGNFVIDKDKFGNWRFVLKGAGAGICYYGESYATKDAAMSSSESVKKFAMSAKIVVAEDED